MLSLTNVWHRLPSTLESRIEGVVWFSEHGASGFDSVLILLFFFFENGFFSLYRNKMVLDCGVVRQEMIGLQD